jgi:hypothetical protein
MGPLSPRIPVEINSAQVAFQKIANNTQDYVMLHNKADEYEAVPPNEVDSESEKGFAACSVEEIEQACLETMKGLDSDSEIEATVKGVQKLLKGIEHTQFDYQVEKSRLEHYVQTLGRLHEGGNVDRFVKLHHHEKFIERLPATLNLIKMQDPSNYQKYLTTVQIVVDAFASQIEKQDYSAALEFKFRAADVLCKEIEFDPLSCLANSKVPLEEMGGFLSAQDTALVKNARLHLVNRIIDGKPTLQIDFKLQPQAVNQVRQNIKNLSSNLESANKLGLVPNISITEEGTSYPGKVEGEDSFSSAKGFTYVQKSSDQAAEDSDWEDSFEEPETIIPSKQENTIHFEGVGTLKIGEQNVYCENNHLSLSIDSTLSQETINQRLLQMLSIVGLGPALCSQRDVDDNRIQLLTLLRCYYPKEAYKLVQDPDTYSCSIEELKKKIISCSGDMAEKIENELSSMYKQEVYPGHEVWAVKGIADKARAAGGIGLMMGLGQGALTTEGLEKLARSLAKKIKFGAMSTQDRLTHGNMSMGNSPYEDLVVGGGDSVFTRIIKANMGKLPIKEISMRGQAQMLLNLDLIERGGYAYLHDEYGTRGKGIYDGDKRIDLINHIINLDDSHYANEYMVKNRIPPEFIKGVVVQNQANKDFFIRIFNEEGIIINGEILGKPIDKFLTVLKEDSSVLFYSDLFK